MPLTSRRMRTLSALSGLGVAASLLAAVPAQADEKPLKPRISVREVPAPVVQEPAAPPEGRWDIASCREEADKHGGYVVAFKDRFNACRVSKVQFSISDPAAPAKKAWISGRSTMTFWMDRNNRVIRQQFALDKWNKTPEGNVDLFPKLESAEFTISLQCVGIADAKCDKGPVLVGRHKPVAWYPIDETKEAIWDTSGSARTNPDDPDVKQAFPEAKSFYVDDKVAYFGVGALFTSDNPTEEAFGHLVVRCDDAEYLAAKGGCILRDESLVFASQYADNPTWAKHIVSAQKTPYQTFPYLQDPNAGANGKANPYGWNKPFNMPGSAYWAPSSTKPLTRLYAGKKLTGDDGKNARSQYRGNRYVVGRKTCKYLKKNPGEECDEYPFASTWQGAKSTEQYPNDPWKFSIRYIDKKSNRDAGNALQRFYYSNHVLATGDAYRVAIDNVPASPAAHRDAVRAYEERKARAAALPRAPLAPIPDDQLCTSDELGGRFSCEYGEEWHQFDNGGWQVWVVGADRKVYTNYTTGTGAWSGWQDFGGQATGGVEVVDADGSAVTVATTGTDGLPWYRDRNPATGAWTEWHR
ncbi:hypothetical protein [Streptomyces sp. NPDC058308]|uniref:NucA/NucB deoxyribonuclease domain-containing protein n=1 Tax=Streptomyces sp. NPDC058308 TaxID=3346440 RepID=UPI0036EA3E07